MASLYQEMRLALVEVVLVGLYYQIRVLSISVRGQRLGSCEHLFGDLDTTGSAQDALDVCAHVNSHSEIFKFTIR